MTESEADKWLGKHVTVTFSGGKAPVVGEFIKREDETYGVKLLGEFEMALYMGKLFARDILSIEPL